MPTVSSAFGALSAKDRRRVLGMLVAATTAQLRVFASFEREMKRTGGPGIIAFELAGATVRAREILTTWGSHGRSAAKKSLLLDYLFPPTYATLQALACDATADVLAKRGRRSLAGAGTPLRSSSSPSSRSVRRTSCSAASMRGWRASGADRSTTFQSNLRGESAERRVATYPGCA